MKTEIKKLEKSKVELNFELSAEELDNYLDKALDHLRKHVKADGFRPGTVPKDLAAKKIGEETLLMEAGDMAVRESYELAVREHQLEPVSKPEAQITKLAKGNPFVFKISVEVLPEIQLPDYQKIAAKIKDRDITVDEKEITDAINYLQKSRATFSKKETGAEKKDYVEISYQQEHVNEGKEVKDRFILGEGGFLDDFEEQITGMKAGEEKTFDAKLPDNHPNQALAGKKVPFTVKMISVQKMELPEVNDEFAKALGAFDGLAGLSTSLKEGISTEKQTAEKQRRREEMLDQIAKEVKVELPAQMVAYEQERLFEDMKSQVAKNAAVDFDQYLAEVKKTEQEVKDSLLTRARQRIKDFLVLREIGKQEKIEVTAEELQAEMNNILKNYRPEQADKIDINQLRAYTKDMVQQEKVFQKLEELSKKHPS